jgi:hypothetical protein
VGEGKRKERKEKRKRKGKNGWMTGRVALQLIQSQLLKKPKSLRESFSVLESHGNNTLSHGYLGRGGHSINNHRVTIG